MKLRTISEIQYKQNSTNLDRAQSPGVRAQDSINDLYHKKKKPTEKSGSDEPDKEDCD